MNIFMSSLLWTSRRLWREKPFTLTALLILAVCIGANLTIFAVVDSVLIRPLPFPDAGRLVTLFNSYPKAGVRRDESSLTNYYERRGNIAALSEIAIYWENTATVGETGATEQQQIMRVSPEFLATLGFQPMIGRAFSDAEMTPQTDAVVILSYGYWRERFNADPQVLGKNVRMNGVPRRVVGVLPAEFRFLSSQARIYVPLSSNPSHRGPKDRHSGSAARIIARLQPQASIAEAQSQIDAHNAAVGADDPLAKVIADAGFHTVVAPLHRDHVAAVRQPLLITQAGVLLLLLLGAVNLMNLLLVRAGGRVKELAIRLAIGSSRANIVKEVLTESVLLTTMGGIGGVALGAAGVRLLALLGGSRLPLAAGIALDARVGAVALVLSLILGVGVGIPIAWFHLKRDIGNGLSAESRGGTADPAAQRLRHAFIVAQIAFAFVLLGSAGLLSLSLKQAMDSPAGFRVENILSGAISLPRAGYDSGQAQFAFTERLIEQINRRPGVIAAGVVTRLPFGGNTIKSAVTVRGYRVPQGESIRGHYWYAVMGDYFKALDIPLVEGRVLETADSKRQQRMCVVDEDFARRYWPGGDVLGQQLYQGPEETSDAEAFTVVGVVKPVKQAELTETADLGAVYFPFAHSPNDSFSVVARTAGAPDAVAPALQTIVRAIDPELPVNDVRSMDSRIGESLDIRRSLAVLTVYFAVVAVLLTAVGTYGVVSYAVGQRRREIGVRMALGAVPGQIRGEFLTMAARLIAAGAIPGMAATAIAGRVLQPLLFKVPAFHAPTLLLTATLILLISFAASVVPACRAARISPAEALSD
jgi:predicted permease